MQCVGMIGLLRQDLAIDSLRLRQAPGLMVRHAGFEELLESHLVEGRQDYVPGRPAVYGQSITDACISLTETDALLELFAKAQQARGTRTP